MGRMQVSYNPSPRLVALSIAFLILSVGGLANASWDGTQHLVLGDRVSAMFVSTPGAEVHYFTFYAPDDTKLDVSWKTAKGQVLAVDVLDPSMESLDAASFTKGRRIKRLPLPTRGRHTIQVVATQGTGRYQLKTSGRYSKKFGGKNIETPDDDDYEFEIGMPAGTKFSAKVKRKGKSGGKPVFTSFEGPSGDVDFVSPNTASIKKLTIPATGLFVLTVAGADGAKINLTVKARFPVGKSPYRFDEMEVTPGTHEAFRKEWLTSAHADLASEPFSHWNDDSPAVVPQNCAKCHSGLGYRDFLGVLANPLATPPETTPSSNLMDPSPSPGQAQIASGPWPVGTPINCDTCHNLVTLSLSEVTFASGLTVTDLGDESRCMICHQGRESTVSVEKRISDAYADDEDPIMDDDTVSSSLNFLNVHYFAAAGSLYGRLAKAAYEYPDPALSDLDPDPVTGLSARMSYDSKFAHVAQKDVCYECHNQHSLKVRVEDCAGCHVNRNGDPIVTAEPTTDEEYEAAIDNLHDVRMAGTINDFDGDGDTNEGVYYEMTGVRDVLYDAIRAYAKTAKMNASGDAVPVTPIAYSPSRYPYFFVDDNDNGVIDSGETTRYNAWTARLLRAAYDYQYAQKDPGAFAHNAKYLIEILYDAIADIDSVMPVAAFANLVRNDSGHFDTSAEAYRHWDEEEAVSASCARCHSPEGFLFRAKYGIDQTITAEVSSGMTCETCHETGANFSPLNGEPDRRYIAEVTFPYPSTATSSEIDAVTIENGAEGTSAQDDSYLCMTCHQGRESTLTVDAFNPTTVTTFTLNFRNVHYFPAGGTLYGNRAAVAYQYSAKTYAGPWNHGIAYGGSYPQPATDQAQCKFCHMQDGSHSFEPEVTSECTTLCHVNNPTIDTITPAFRAEDDWDNDSATKPKAEVDVFGARLYAAIQAYCAAAADSMSPPAGASYTAYDGDSYPYWFKDTNKNGVIDEGETSRMQFDSKSLRAAFNYQYYQKEPGAWAHNNPYVVQVLYDSIEDLGGNLTGLTRP